MKDFIEELRWRGMLQNIIPNTQELLNTEMQSAYVGFDPTASSIHIGNLATLMLLVHFQNCGHKPYVLVGGATAMIGDPSGKNAERKLLDIDTIKHNQSCIEKQLRKFLSFDGENSAVVVNNYDWFSGIGYLEFLRDVGKHVTINFMTAKDSVKNRLDTGLSYTEFSYQLLQAYDFLHLYKTNNVKVQMGGSDQWGNITTGTELIRKMGIGEGFAVTTPLITKSDGSKFGKSENGNIWLDPTLTSPFTFYQFWLNVSDDDAEKLIKIFTTLTKDVIFGLIDLHKQEPNKRHLQKRLAEEVTKMVHGVDALNDAIRTSDVLFQNNNIDIIKTLNEDQILDIFDALPQAELSRDTFNNVSHNNVELLCVIGNMIFNSKTEARKQITSGGVYINGTKFTTIENGGIELILNKFIFIKKGKKNYIIKIS